MFFSDIGGTEERHAHYYIHTRVRQASAGVCTRERMEEKGIERLKRKKAGRRGNRSKGGKYEKKGRDRSLLKFYTLGKRKKLCHPQQFD